jgi:hypothetical protein
VKIYQSLFLKSSQRSQWLERCGIRFMGQGKNKIMLIEANTTLTLSGFPNKATEFDYIWDCESSEKRKPTKLQPRVIAIREADMAVVHVL